MIEDTLYDYLCECNDIDCWLKVKLRLTDIPRGSRQTGELFIVVDGCKRGPELGDKLVEINAGYKTYEALE